MLEIKVTIEAPEIVAAVNTLAGAVGSKAGTGLLENHCSDVGVAAPAIGTQTGGGIMPLPVQEAAPPMQGWPRAAQVPAAGAAAATEVPPFAAEKKYTLEDLSNAGAHLVDAGKMPQIMQLINKYGVQAINQLNPAVYGEFAKDLIALGAKF